MKTRIHITVVLPITLALLLFGNVSIQSQTVKKWHQTTVVDFHQGVLDNSAITHEGDGAIRLMPPLVKKFEDTKTSLSKDRVYNAAGSYIQYWRSNGIVYIQRFDSLDHALGSAVRVNDGLSATNPSVAYMDNGYSIVTWDSYYQIHDMNGSPVGTNHLVGGSNHELAPLSHAIDSTFWLFVSRVTYVGLNPDSMILYLWKVGLTGVVIDSMIRIHPTNLWKKEFLCTAGNCSNGDYVLFYYGTNVDYYGGEGNLQLQRFYSNGEPKTQVMSVSSIPDIEFQFLKLAFDDSGRYAALWRDARPRPEQDPSLSENLYIQLFDSTDRKVGENMAVNSLKAGMREGSLSTIYFKNSTYVLTWEADSMSFPIPTVFRYTNELNYNFAMSGSFTSAVYDAGPLLTAYDSLDWTALLPAQTAITFQIRSAHSLADFQSADWHGPGNSPDSFYSIPGELIGASDSLHRLIQYKAFFQTQLWGDTPVLNDASITYRIDDTPPPFAPAAITAEATHGKISLSWQPSPSPGILTYKLYRGSESHKYDSSFTKVVSGSTFDFPDTTVTNNTLYYYAVTAVDTNFQESGFSDEVSAKPTAILIYVSSLGGGEGTFESPYATIQEATSHALAYDTIVVLPGTYTGMVHIPAHVALLGSGAKSTTISASGDSNVVQCGDHSMLSGFTIRLAGPVSQGVAIRCGFSSPVIQDNVIISMIPEVDVVDYVAIAALGGTPVFRRNFIVDFEGGITIGAPGSPTINNNIIIARAGGIMIHNDAVAEVTNNTVVIRQFGSGIAVYSYPEGDIRNNLVIGPSTDGGQAFDTPCFNEYLNVVVEYNDAWNFKDNYTCVNPGPGNISNDPLFVNAIAGDYRLNNNSPGRSSGDPRPQYNNPDGSRNDMGAFGGPAPINLDMLSGFDASFGIQNSSGFPGDTVEVGMFVTNAARVAHADFRLEYDAALARLLSVQQTPVSDSMQVTFDTSSAGVLTAGLHRESNLNMQGGTILFLKFKISPDAHSGDATSLALPYVSLRDERGSSVALHEVQHGVLIVSRGSDGGRYIFVDRRNDSGIEDGTRFHPCRTIALGISFATAGDTVLVGSGTYEEVISIPDSIHVQGSGASVTILRPDSANGGLLKPAVDFNNVRNASITKFSLSSVTSEFFPPVGPIRCRNSSVEISGCLLSSNRSGTLELLTLSRNSEASIHDNLFVGGTGTVTFGDSSRAEIFRNEFRSTDGAINIGLGSGTIRNNIFTGAASGTQISVHATSPLNIENNLFQSSNATSILAINTDSLTIANNTIVGGFTGIDARNTTMQALNNIITGNSTGIFFDSESSTTSYNDVWGNATNYNTVTPELTGISLRPMFADSSHHDFRLAAGSPCRDAGNPDPVYNDPDQSRNDMGTFGGPHLDTTFFEPRGATLRISSIVHHSGDTVSIPLTGLLLRGIASADLGIRYDPARLLFSDARTGNSTAMFTLNRSEDVPGEVRLRLASPAGLRSDSATILLLRFIPKAGAFNTTLKFLSANLKSETTSELPVGKLVDGTIIITGMEAEAGLPSDFRLEQNYPNPFNPETRIRYAITNRQFVSLRVYDILGREVAMLVDGIQDAGFKSVTWNAREVSSGVYFYRLQAGGNMQVRKMVVIR